MSFFSPKSELVLIFDIGSSSVGAGLIRLAHNEPPRVIHSINEPIPYQEKIDPDRLFRDMVESLKKAYEDIIKQGASHLNGTEFKHVNISRVFYSFTSPWSATQTKTLSIKKSEAFTFTHELLNNLMFDEEEKFKKEAIGEQRVFPEALSVIERRIIQTRINGYDIKDPFGRKTLKADISYFSGIVPKSVIDKTMEVSHTFHISKHIKVFTFPLVAYSAIRDMFQDENDFIELRVGGEISDVSIIDDGVITESASFPQGQNHVIRKIAGGLNMTKEETNSFLKLYMEGHAEKDLVIKFGPIIERCMHEWVIDLRTVLGKLENSMFLSQKLFLVINSELSHLFVTALETGDTPFSVTLLDSPIVLFSSFVHHIYESEKK